MAVVTIRHCRGLFPERLGSAKENHAGVAVAAADCPANTNFLAFSLHFDIL
jgi:hypothetical protein